LALRVFLLGRHWIGGGEKLIRIPSFMGSFNSIRGFKIWGFLIKGYLDRGWMIIGFTSKV